MLLGEGHFGSDLCPDDSDSIQRCRLVYSWRPILPGQYEVLVHEIDQGSRGKTPLIPPSPHPFVVTELVVGAGLTMLEERMSNMPPCQSQRWNESSLRWEGDWLGPDVGLENSLRTGWSFLPSRRMGCMLQTFDKHSVQRSLPEMKSIFILGRSVERGMFLSLVDILLDPREKMYLKDAIVGKCWGRASITKGYLKVVYQDFRSATFEDPTRPPFIECHNDNLVKEIGSSYTTNATQVWEEIFHGVDKSNWPSVIYYCTAFGTHKFVFDYHVKLFVDMLPPTWHGTLLIGDMTFSAQMGGYVSLPEYETYLKDIHHMMNALGHDSRVRWIDGHGISKEMRMYSQQGEEYVARSQHFHNYCKRSGSNGEVMNVCSNVTEMMGQLLLGHALSPKAEYTTESLGNTNSTLTWCHACPECLLPFAIIPNPQMTCVTGPIFPKKSVFLRSDDSEKCRMQLVRMKANEGRDPRSCPLSCLEEEPTSEFRTESDTVHVRQCLII